MVLTQKGLTTLWVADSPQDIYTAGVLKGDLLFIISTGELRVAKADNEWTSQKSAGAITEYMYPVWAEENAALAANAYEWAFGNGANSPSDGGMTIYVPTGWKAEVVSMSLRIGSGTATVQLVHNGTPQGASANVAVSTGQSATNELATPLELSNNDFINFRTQAASGTSGPNVVTAWIKMTKI